MHARLWGVERGVASQRIDDVVAAFGLGELIDRPVSTYSGGQRRRLEIARALLSEPKVLFLDEPTVGLDPRFRHELLDLIAGLREQEGMTILLTTHYLDEAEQLCDRVAIVHQGRIVALDTPAALLAGMGREIVELRVTRRRRTRGVVAAGARHRRDGHVRGRHERARTASWPSGAQTVADITDMGLAATAITSRTPTLDDVYLQLTGASLAA